MSDSDTYTLFRVSLSLPLFLSVTQDRVVILDHALNMHMEIFPFVKPPLN